MKRRTIAIFIIFALASLYLWLSWFTGKIIADHIDKDIYQMDQFLNNHQKVVKFKSSYSDYNASIFSTTFNLTITAKTYSSGKNNLIKSPTIVFDDKITIYHGPFPWSELKSFQFKPKIASINYKISEKTAPKLWSLVNNKPYLTATMSLDYNQDLNLQLTSLPINKINLTDTSIYNISKGILTFDITHNFSKFDLNIRFRHLKIKDHQLNIDLSGLSVNATSISTKDHNLSYKLSSSLAKASISRKESHLDKESINLNNINYYTTLDNNFKSGFNYTNKLAIDTIYLHDKYKNIHINNVDITNENKSKNNSAVYGAVDYKIGNVLVGNQNFGFGSAQISYENLPVSSLNLLANYFVKKKALPHKSDLIKLSLDKLHWENAHGVMEMKLCAILKNITLDENYSFTDVRQDNVNQLGFSLNIPFETLTYFVAQASNISTQSISQNHMEKAYQNTLLLTNLLRNSPSLQIVLPKEDRHKITPGIYSSLHYDSENQRAIINGESVPADHFFKKLRLFN